MSILVQGIEQYQIPDDALFRLGDDSDGVLLLKSASILANTVWPGVFVGTPVTPALPANSVVLSNITASGDILMATNMAGDSIAGLWLDGSAGDAALLAASGASVDHYIAGTKRLDHSAGVFAFQEATTISTTTGNLVIDSAGFINSLDDILVGTLAVGSTRVVGIHIAAGVPRFTLERTGAGANAKKWEFDISGGDTTDLDLVTLTDANVATARMQFKRSGVVILGAGESGVTAPTGNVFRAPDAATGGAGNVAGADFTIGAGLGTGTGDEGTIIFQLPIVAAAGDNIQTRATRLTLDMAGSSTDLTMSFAQATTISTTTGALTLAPTGGSLLFTGTLALTGSRVTQSYHTNITSTNAVTVDSSETVKHDIAPYTADALAIVKRMDVITFRHDSWLDPSQGLKLGIRGESVSEPLAVQMLERDGGHHYPGLNLYGLGALHTRSIQQIAGRVERLERQLVAAGIALEE